MSEEYVMETLQTVQTQNRTPIQPGVLTDLLDVHARSYTYMNILEHPPTGGEKMQIFDVPRHPDRLRFLQMSNRETVLSFRTDRPEDQPGSCWLDGCLFGELRW